MVELSARAFLRRGPAAEPASYRMPLPAATWYATELAAVMLNGEGDDLLAATREIQTRTMLLDWCDRCAAAIAARTDRERAEGFRDKVQAALRRRLPGVTVLDDEGAFDLT
jgi:hypothetical protein